MGEQSMDEQIRMANPFTPVQVLSSILSKKTTPTKKVKETQKSWKNHSKTRKLDMRCFVASKAAIPTFPHSLAKTAVPATTTTVTGSFTQPDMQTQNLCAPSGKLCSFTSPPHSNWSAVEEERMKRERTSRERKGRQGKKTVNRSPV